MTTSLKASGADRRQAGAIEKSAVTPEKLRETIKESQQAQLQRIKEETDRQIELTNQRFDEVVRRLEGMRAERRADWSKLNNLTLATALGVAVFAGMLLMDLLSS